LPEPSTATPFGWPNTGHNGSQLLCGRVPLFNGLVLAVCNVHVAVGVHSHAERAVQVRGYEGDQLLTGIAVREFGYLVRALQSLSSASI
jgi:hypothetical protein